MGKQVITADDIMKRTAGGETILQLNQNECIITPGAWDKIEEMGLRFAGDAAAPSELSAPGPVPAAPAAGAGAAFGLDAVAGQVCAILKDRLPAGNASGIEAIVKKVVAERLGKTQAAPEASQPATALTTRGGVSLISGDALLDEAATPAMPGKVAISDAVRCHKDSPLSATYMKWEASSFSRVVESPEISIVVEGEMDLTVDGRTLKARAGDILYMERGAEVGYNSTGSVKLACISS